MINIRCKRSIFILLITAVVLLSACQPTPENEIVPNKQNTQMDEIVSYINKPRKNANDNTSSNIQSPEPTQTKQQTYEYQATLADKLTLNVDAILDVQDGAWDVTSCVPREFSQDEINLIGSILIGDVQLYKPINTHTKEALMQDFINYKRKWAEGERDVSEDEYLQGFKYFEDAIAQAPEKVEPEPASLQIESLESFGGMRRINVMTYPKNREEREVLKARFADLGCMISYFRGNGRFVNMFQPGENDQYRNLKTSPEEAILQADELLNKLGITHMSQVAAAITIGEGIGSKHWSECEQAYVITYIREFGDNTSTYDIRYKYNYSNNLGFVSNRVLSVTDGNVKTAYSLSLPYEVIEVYIDDNGICGFEWVCPMQVKETLKESVGLISFKEISDTFEQHMKIENIWEATFHGDDEHIKNMVININRITLGYTRIKAKDNQGVYLLVPVWDFFGNIEIYYTEEYYTKEHKHPDGYVVTMPESIKRNHSYKSLMTINAIDGTIIDREQGY